MVYLKSCDIDKKNKCALYRLTVSFMVQDDRNEE